MLPLGEREADIRFGPGEKLPNKPPVLFDPNDPFDQEVQELLELHSIKKADYADMSNQFSNFIEAAEWAGVTVEQAIQVLIGTKIARLRNLKKSGKMPKNESIQDTEKDLIVYGIILRAWRREMRLTEELNKSLRT